jgi:hypothetical protein
MQITFRLAFFALASAGRRRPARMAMMPITTSSSMRVKAKRLVLTVARIRRLDG